MHPGERTRPRVLATTGPQEPTTAPGLGEMPRLGCGRQARVTGATRPGEPMAANITDTSAVAAMRQATELAILQLLLELTTDTGLDLEGVTVRTLVRPLSEESSEPQVVPFAVKIILAV